MSTSYYIDGTSGSDGDTGLVGHPKKTWAAVLALPSAGDEVVVEDGVYLNSVHGPLAVITGTNGLYTAQITIRARNEGKVIVDGEGSVKAIQIYNTSWYTVIGIDFCRSAVNTACGEFVGRGMLIQRCCFWDGGNGNNDVVFVANNGTPGGVPTGFRNAVPASTLEGSLIEDCLFFGTGRYTATSTQQSSAYTRWRRCLFVWDNSTASAGPNAATNNTYNSKYHDYENCIFIQRAEGSFSSYFHGLVFGEGNGSNWDGHTNMRGCLFLVRAGDGAGTGIYNQFVYQMGYDNCVVWIAPEKGTSLFGLGLYSANGTNTGMTVNSCSVLGGGSNTIHSDWVQTPAVHTNASAYAAGFGGYPSATDNLYGGTTGAKVRYRTVDGALTTTELWPWPMNDRIKAAMTAALTRNDGLYTKTEVLDTNAMIRSIFSALPSDGFVAAIDSQTATAFRTPVPRKDRFFVLQGRGLDVAPFVSTIVPPPPPPPLELPPVSAHGVSILTGALEDLELASVRVALAYSGACTFTPNITVEQRRADSGAGLPVSDDIALTWDTSLIDAIMAPVRWTRPRLMFEGNEVLLGRVGTLRASRSMSSELQAMDFQTIGPLWTMSTIEPTTKVTDPCPPVPTVGAVGMSPLSWGNKLVELYWGLSKEKGIVKEVKVFQGRTYQKSSSRDTGISAQFTAVDESILYAKLPICYELPAFAGKRRGEIVKDLAAAVGIDPAQVIVPVGKEVTKPLLLSNEHLLPFLDAFGAPENWLSYFDEFGRLVVEVVDLADTPHWTYDASRGDYEIDSFKETLPSGPPTRYYVTATQPVSGTGPGGSDLDVTSKTTEQLQELYAPQTDKVRPSGLPSYLYADGSYRSITPQQLMVVARRTDYSTTRNGTPIRSREVLEGFYNPAAVDPNFDSAPPTTNYNAAYGDRTFHRDEVEPFVTIEEATSEGAFDLFGTLQRQVKKTFGWYSPRHALLHSGDPTTPLKNYPGVGYVYPGGIMRRDAVEQFIERQRVEQEYSYASDGTLFETVETVYEWFSPKSRADIVVVVVDPTVPPIPILDSPPLPSPPPPAPPPAPHVWQPYVSGPSRRDRNTFYFDLNFGNAPQLGAVTGAITTPAAWLVGPPSMNVSSSARVDQGNGFTAFQNGSGNGVGGSIVFGDNFPKSVAQRYKVILAATTKPVGFQYAFVELIASIPSGPEAGTFKSNRLQFDPWAGLPAGADLTRV